jgi:hypothetical protein
VNAKKNRTLFADLKINPILSAFKTRGNLRHALRKKEKTPQDGCTQAQKNAPEEQA